VAEPLQVEIAYAEPQRAIVKVFTLAPGSTVADALKLAAGEPDFAAVNWEHCAPGIFGRAARPEQVLRTGDRLELYRPLSADPKTARRARAKEARTAGTAPAGTQASKSGLVQPPKKP
jgi:putative ubiquitin-RnfH superfamily antitoxin RatB of RatAB toxin-antitoxin module